jgi:glycosyltransferase involved in cell wall biosynthesis
MKLAYVTHTVSPDLHEFMLGSLGDEMTKRGHEVHIITPSMGELPSNDDVIKVWRLPSLDLNLLPGGTNYPLFARGSLKEVIKRIRPDVIHAQSHLFLTTRESIGVASGLGIPSVVTVHGFSVNRDLLTNSLQRTYLGTIGRNLLRKATTVHCLSETERDSVLRLQPRANTVVIPNGVDTNMFKPSEAKDESRVVWVGRMVPEKGLKQLLSALDLVTREFRDLNVVFIGDGPLRGYLEEGIRKRNLGRKCTLLGTTSRQVVASVLSQSSIFVMPSLSEGMPYAMLEAMASENAVIASDLPTIREVIEDHSTGILVPPQDHVRLAEAMCECLDDAGSSRRLAANARKRVIGGYSLSIFFDRISSLYLGLRRDHN